MEYKAVDLVDNGDGKIGASTDLFYFYNIT